MTESEYRSIDERGSFLLERNKSDGTYHVRSIDIGENYTDNHSTINDSKSEKIFVDSVTNVIPASVKSRGNYSGI